MIQRLQDDTPLQRYPMNRAGRIPRKKKSWTLSKKRLSSLFPPVTRPLGLPAVRNREH